ncbi:MAG: hypothetical protein ACTSX6_07910 [Candidatus Heimdallarchaeaceae archaeon]
MPVREFKEDKYELTDLASANIEGLGLYINFLVQKLDELIGAFNELEERVIEIERKLAK